jgi:8-amino-7-oxononanoate synthase
MPPHSLMAIGCAFDFLRGNIDLQNKLQLKIKLLLNGFEKINLNRVNSQSAIQNVIVAGNIEVKKLAGHLQERKLDCRPILSPTVKEGTERIRICLHSFNTDGEIKMLNSALKDFA